uniref:Uncharacterized protein n=1 Tax=Metapenaeus joyneri majanivirus TaxID=2984280 RepID=A0A9C7BZQ7_9VIRU|nr:MAG: hypothetical protein [Metapenaeus joyneri majanivirus]
MTTGDTFITCNETEDIDISDEFMKRIVENQNEIKKDDDFKELRESYHEHNNLDNISCCYDDQQCKISHDHDTNDNQSNTSAYYAINQPITSNCFNNSEMYNTSCRATTNQLYSINTDINQPSYNSVNELANNDMNTYNNNYVGNELCNTSYETSQQLCNNGDYDTSLNFPYIKEFKIQPKMSNTNISNQNILSVSFDIVIGPLKYITSPVPINTIVHIGTNTNQFNGELNSDGTINVYYNDKSSNNSNNNNDDAIMDCTKFFSDTIPINNHKLDKECDNNNDDELSKPNKRLKYMDTNVIVDPQYNGEMKQLQNNKGTKKKTTTLKLDDNNIKQWQNPQKHDYIRTIPVNKRACPKIPVKRNLGFSNFQNNFNNLFQKPKDIKKEHTKNLRNKKVCFNFR